MRGRLKGTVTSISQWTQKTQANTNYGDKLNCHWGVGLASRTLKWKWVLCVLPSVLQVYGLLLSGNSAPTDVFTQPLLPVINELSACVCVETTEGSTQSHMYRRWTDKRTNFFFFFLMRRLSVMFALKTACQLSNYIFRYLQPKSLSLVATVEYSMVFLSKYGVMYVFMGFTTLNFSDFY